MAELKNDYLEILTRRVKLIIFFLGIFILIFSIMKINRWNQEDIELLGGLGLLAIVFGFDIMNRETNYTAAAAGFVISVFGLLLNKTPEAAELSGLITLLYPLGMTILLCNILDGFFVTRKNLQEEIPNKIHPPEDDIVFEYKQVIRKRLSDTMDTVEGLCSQLSEEKNQINGEVKREICIILDTMGTLAMIQHEDENPSIRMLYNTLDEHLILQNITEIQANIGDIFNPKIHECINSIQKDGMVRRIKQVVNKGYMRNSPNTEEIIRKVVVDVDWIEKPDQPEKNNDEAGQKIEENV